MTAVQIPTSEVLFTKLLCYLGEWHPDSDDAGDKPDLMTVGGKVRLTINTPENLLVVRLGGAPARLTRFKAQEFIIQTASGELVDMNGVVGVSVPRSDSPGISPVNWTITAEIQFAGSSAWKKVTFEPKVQEEFNLIELVSVGVSSGQSDLAARVAALEAGGVSGSAYPVQQVTLTGNLVQSTTDWPTDQVVTVVYTQDATGGHTVTYGGQPVSVDPAPGAATVVELYPVGAGYVVRYPVTNLDAQVSALAEDGGSALGASLSSTYVTATITGDPADPDVTLYLNGVEL